MGLITIASAFIAMGILMIIIYALFSFDDISDIWSVEGLNQKTSFILGMLYTFGGLIWIVIAILIMKPEESQQLTWNRFIWQMAVGWMLGFLLICPGGIIVAIRFILLPQDCIQLLKDNKFRLPMIVSSPRTSIQLIGILIVVIVIVGAYYFLPYVLAA